MTLKFTIIFKKLKQRKLFLDFTLIAVVKIINFDRISVGYYWQYRNLYEYKLTCAKST